MRKTTLGILFSDKEWEQFMSMAAKERIDLYFSSANKYNLKIAFFRLRDIDIETKTVQALTKLRRNRWLQERIPIPKVIHNRAVHSANAIGNQLEELRATGAIIYNYWNNYSKLDIHRLISKDPLLKKYLPKTRPFTKTNMDKFLKYPSFFLKPEHGSVGKGIIKVDRYSKGFWNIICQYKETKKIHKVTTQSLFSTLKRYKNKGKYILQKTIDLMTYKGCPFDIRISVQKNQNAIWQVTGMVGKVAKEGYYLSNVFQGGNVVRLEELFDHDSRTDELKTKLSNISLNIAGHLDRYLPNLADVGFDFGIAATWKPYFIEMNCRDQRYSFLLGDMLNEFQNTYRNPVGYGRYLLDHVNSKT